MKILWITNVLFDYHHCLLGNDRRKATTSGSWLSAAYDVTKKNPNIELHVATTSDVPETLVGQSEGTHFYILPGGSLFRYDVTSEINLTYIKKLRAVTNPDLIIIWGTESRFAWLVSKVFDDVPKYVYMQGVMSSIVEHFYDAVPSEYHYSTIKDYVNYLFGKTPYQIYKKHIKFEDDIIDMSDGVIVENDWCENQCLGKKANLRVIRDNLPIRSTFYQCKWELSKMIPHTIFTNAGGTSIKGHHILFRALAIVKKEFPNVKLYIPGNNYLLNYKSIRKATGYIKYLYKLYTNYQLSENIVFTGVLSSEEMAEYVRRSNVYVMPSLVENHSSSLIEAMIVGAPCITSLVGGTANLIQYGKNGYIYNSLEPVTLAGCITSIFRNSDKAESFANEAYKLRDSRKQNFENVLLELEKLISK